MINLQSLVEASNGRYAITEFVVNFYTPAFRVLILIAVIAVVFLYVVKEKIGKVAILILLPVTLMFIVSSSAVMIYTDVSGSSVYDVVKKSYNVEVLSVKSNGPYRFDSTSFAMYGIAGHTGCEAAVLKDVETGDIFTANVSVNPQGNVVVVDTNSLEVVEPVVSNENDIISLL